ncbi:MAG: nucleoside kinase [Anaerolineaceae bacterium]|nr:nucleoside kinase [Anaerolineaceae bacterium]
MNQTSIILSKPRDEVRITLDDGTILSGPYGTTLETFLTEGLHLSKITPTAELLAAVGNGKLLELTHQVSTDMHVQPITLANSDGSRIYRRSLVLLMVTAIEELWPGTTVSVNYAIPDGGYYCELIGQPVTEDDIKKLEAHMRAIVDNDDLITKRSITIDEARDLFKRRSELDKVRLLRFRHQDTITMYRLRGRDDYYYGYMVPSTAYLQTFKLVPANGGFILQYPRKENPDVMQPITTLSKLITVFRQTDQWLERLGVEDIGRLNQVVTQDRIQELILVAEALHEQNVASISSQIVSRYDSGTRLVLIAGPSSSGKTTFAKRLAIQLLAHGLHPFTLELDNYFVDREHTPRDENGDYDFESIHALNLPLFNENLIKLMDGERVQIPNFNFLTGKSEAGKEIQLDDRQVIIVEGIHGLNPNLVPAIPAERIFRVYVSALTQLNIDLHNRVSTTDVRLLRRIVRDARRRGYSATDTIARWPSVRRGEKTNIFPYQENADAMFNSALPYELTALRRLAEPLLLQVEPRTRPHIEANRLLSFLRWVTPLNLDQMQLVPDTSLLREFIGGSILDDYHPGATAIVDTD